MFTELSNILPKNKENCFLSSFYKSRTLLFQGALYDVHFDILKGGYDIFMNYFEFEKNIRRVYFYDMIENEHKLFESSFITVMKNHTNKCAIIETYLIENELALIKKRKLSIKNYNEECLVIELYDVY